MGPFLKVVVTRAALLLGAVLAMSLGSSPASAQEHCGAIAISQSTGRLGWSYDFGNRNDAENAAKKECAKGATDCRVPVWFCNACGAIATTPDLGYGSGWAENREDAERNALKVCQDYNPGKRCSIQRWVCTTR